MNKPIIYTVFAALLVGTLSPLGQSAALAEDSKNIVSPDSSVVLSPDESVSLPAEKVVEDSERKLSKENVVAAVAMDEFGHPTIVSEETTSRKEVIDAVEEYQVLPNVVSVEVSPVAKILQDSSTDPLYSTQWNLSKLGMEQAWSYSKGSNIIVGLLDTGVTPTHPDLSANLLSGKDFSNTPSSTMSDPLGHGTQVAGVMGAVANNGIGIRGVTPEIKILPVKVFESDGTAFMSNVAKGVIYAVDSGAKVLNLSLGSESASAALESAIDYAYSKGVLVVAAGGNSRQDGNTPMHPASYPKVLAVAAVDKNFASAPFSNTGSYIDIAAPGVLIPSTLNTGSYGTSSGTSIAAPHVSSIAALLYAINGSTNVDTATQLLTSTAVDKGPAGVDQEFGYGFVNPVSALSSLSQSPPPVDDGSGDIPVDDPSEDPGDDTWDDSGVVPSPVSGVQWSLSDKKLNVYWDEPAGLPEYYLYRGIGSSEWTTTTDTQVSFPASPGSYVFEILAANEFGEGEVSEYNMVVPSLPNKVKKMFSSNKGKKTIISWKKPTNSVISTYSVRVGEKTKKKIRYSKWVSLTSPRAMFKTKKGTTYIVQVKGVNSLGAGAKSSFKIVR